MLVLEREDRARARGAQSYARIEGYGSTCDAYHRVQMDPDGDEIVRCIETALARAHRRPEEIGYINYHGTSTQLNDAIEVADACGACSARMPDRVPGSSTKSMIGHPQGASGAAGVAATALAMTRRPAAADDQPRRSGSGLRHGLHPEHAAARPTSTRRSATASGSDRRTARSCWDAPVIRLRQGSGETGSADDA